MEIIERRPTATRAHPVAARQALIMATAAVRTLDGLFPAAAIALDGPAWQRAVERAR